MWAEHQANLLEAQVEDWRANGGYGVVYEPQGDSAEQIIRLKTGPTPWVFPLFVGNILYAMRSALDLLAYALAEAHTDPLPADAAGTSEFPIFSDRPMTAGERSRKIGAIHPDAQAVIDSLQPYHRDDFTSDPLWQLHELARIDRHRVPHVVFAQFGALTVGGTNVHIESLTIGDLGRTTEDGAELGRIAVRPIDPGAPMHLDVKTPPQIALGDGPFADRPVRDLIDGMLRHIMDEVVAPLEPFLS